MSFLALANILESLKERAKLALVWVIERHLVPLCSQGPARLVPDNTPRYRVAKKLKVGRWESDLKVREIKETWLVLGSTKLPGLL